MQPALSKFEADRLEWLRHAIAGITAELKGSMPNIERALLVADRKDFREELSRLESKLTRA